MYKLYEEKNPKLCLGKAFELRDKQCGNVIETIHVNLSGEVIKLEHDSSASQGVGSCTNTPKDSNFMANVEFFMKSLLQQNIYEFQRMRNSLNTRWRAVAERIRKASA